MRRKSPNPFKFAEQNSQRKKRIRFSQSRKKSDGASARKNESQNLLDDLNFCRIFRCFDMVLRMQTTKAIDTLNQILNFLISFLSND